MIQRLLAWLGLVLIACAGSAPALAGPGQPASASSLAQPSPLSPQTSAQPATPPPPPPILLPPPPPAPPPRARAQDAPRIVAIGDLHGDHAAFRAILGAAGLADSRGSWIGGEAILVQTGDVSDRGPGTLQIIRDLMRLQREAAAAGGRVVALVGNHEAMNVTGDLRYVHPGEYAAFADEDSGERRRDFYDVNQAAIERDYRSRQRGLSEDEIRRLWIEDTPHGKVEHRAAWAPDGEIGRWIANNPAVVMIDGTIFAHGGISPAYSTLSIEEINARASAALAVADDRHEAIINDPEGPLWYRGYLLRDGRGREGRPRAAREEEVVEEVEAVLDAYGARRLVVGHTPSVSGIRILLGGRLVGVDSGIASHYGGVRSYLEIQGDAVAAHVVEGGED